MGAYAEVYAGWQADPEGFWMRAAEAIDWIEAPSRALDDSRAPLYGWYPDGVCNACWNAVDRHVEAGHGERVAIIHDSLAGTQGAWFSELFSTNTRSSGASVGYQFSAAISGFIPLIATAVAVPMGWGGVALVYMACGVLGLIGTVLTRETWGKRQRAEVDAIIERS